MRVCVVYRRELWLLSRARPPYETVERTPKGKRPGQWGIIRLGEQSAEVERRRHVCSCRAGWRCSLSGCIPPENEGPSTYIGERGRKIYLPRR